MAEIIFTIGHSTHPLERFISMLKRHDITALWDVRSKPFSRMNPQFNRENLRESLGKIGMTYIFLGRELGGRSDDASCYLNGKVQYDRLAQTDLFRQGLERVQEGMKEYTLALVCAEKDPLECHRAILISRHLASRKISVKHILEDGSLESHEKALERLLHQLRLPEQDLLHSKEEMVDEAYRIQGRRIAYELSKADIRKEKSVGSIFR